MNKILAIVSLFSHISIASSNREHFFKKYFSITFTFGLLWTIFIGHTPKSIALFTGYNLLFICIHFKIITVDSMFNLLPITFLKRYLYIFINILFNVTLGLIIFLSLFILFGVMGDTILINHDILLRYFSYIPTILIMVFAHIPLLFIRTTKYWFVFLILSTFYVVCMIYIITLFVNYNTPIQSLIAILTITLSYYISKLIYTRKV